MDANAGAAVLTPRGPIDNLSSTRLPTESQQKRTYSEENLSEHNLNSLRRHFSENLSICVNIFLKNRTFGGKVQGGVQCEVMFKVRCSSD